jgi:acetyl esterase/lipase
VKVNYTALFWKQLSKTRGGSVAWITDSSKFVAQPLIQIMKIFFAVCMFCVASQWIMAQTIPLYPEKIPGSKEVADEEKTEKWNGIDIVRNITRPTLSIFLADTSKATGTAVIICPGGGYGVNAITHEGLDVAKAFNEAGVTAFVLKYRIPNGAAMTNKEIGPLQDVQQAFKVVRENAALYKINPSRIGLMGFSAGGHLASTAGTHFENKLVQTSVSIRPDFLMLIYPVISFKDSIGHIGSRDQLIGKNPSKDKIDFYSNDLRVTKNTPPTFLVHATDDDAVKVENSILFYLSLVKNKVPAELHVYQKGGHGFGMNNPTTADKWMERCFNWMGSNGWLSK